MLKKWTGIVLAGVLFLSVSPATVRAEMLRYSIEPQYETGAPFVQGFAAVRKDGKWGYIDKKGTVVIPFKYDTAQNFNGGISVVGMNNGSGNKFGFIDDHGVELTPQIYDSAFPIGDGYGKMAIYGPSGEAWDNPKSGLISKNFIVPPIYEEIGSFTDGMFNAKKMANMDSSMRME